MLLKQIEPYLMLAPIPGEEGNSPLLRVDGDRKILWEFMRHFLPETGLLFARIGQVFGKGAIEGFEVNIKKSAWDEIMQRQVGVSLNDALLWPKPRKKGFVEIRVDRQGNVSAKGAEGELLLQGESLSADDLVQAARQLEATIIFPDKRTLSNLGLVSMPGKLLELSRPLGMDWAYIGEHS